METAHRPNDEVVRIDAELFAEFQEVGSNPNSSEVDGIMDARDLVDPKPFDEALPQGEGDREESINRPSIYDAVHHLVKVHLERLKAGEWLGRPMDGSHPIRDAV